MYDRGSHETSVNKEIDITHSKKRWEIENIPSTHDDLSQYL